MCGVAGIFNTKGERIDAKLLKQFLGKLSHRGPDAQDLYCDQNVGLGHARLSVIDFGTGAQPMRDAISGNVISCNGEIYNYRALRQQLEKKGVVFTTQSDTEVLLNGYGQYGVSFFKELEGMYAGLLWDPAQKILHAFRDPFGIKPLYRCHIGANIFFASEPKAFFHLVGFDRTIKKRVWDVSRVLGYLPGHMSYFSQVEQLQPGYVWRIHAEGKISNINFSQILDPQVLANYHTGEVEALLPEAIEHACVADTPIGIYLSGGIDSGLIAATMVKDLGLKPQAYTVGYEGTFSTYDESARAKKLADYLGIDIDRVAFGPKHLRHCETYIEKMSFPSADPSIFPMFELAQHARRDVKVVLSGEGGDELFGGYARYRRFQVLRLVKKLGLHRPLHLLSGLSSLLPGHYQKFWRRLNALIHQPDHEAYPQLFSGWPNDRPMPPELSHLFRTLFDLSTYLAPNQRLRWIDMVTFLTDSLLPKADLTSMAFGLEVRPPFLQKRVLALAFANSQGETLLQQGKKTYLKAVFGQYVPNELVMPEKKGFELPLGTWLREELNPWITQVLGNGPLILAGWVKKDEVTQILNQHMSGEQDNSKALFQMLTWNKWVETHGLILETSAEAGKGSSILSLPALT